MKKNKSYSFELKLVVIAILIPVFLDTFPNIIKGISYSPFTFLFPHIISFLLGFLWFFVLMIGLYNLKKDIGKNRVGKEYFFETFFDVVVYITSFCLIVIFLGYLIVIPAILFNLNIIVMTILSDALFLTAFILFLIYGRKTK